MDPIRSIEPGQLALGGGRTRLDTRGPAAGAERTSPAAALTASHVSLSPVQPPAAEAAAPEAAEETREELLKQRVAEARARLDDTPLDVRIAWDDSWKHVVVQVVDGADQVIQQFPSDEFLEATDRASIPSGLLFEGRS